MIGMVNILICMGYILLDFFLSKRLLPTPFRPPSFFESLLAVELEGEHTPKTHNASEKVGSAVVPGSRYPAVLGLVLARKRHFLSPKVLPKPTLNYSLLYVKLIAL